MRGQITVTDEMFRNVPEIYDKEVTRVAGRWYQPFAYKYANGLHSWLFDENNNYYSMGYFKSLKDDGWDVYRLRFLF